MRQSAEIKGTLPPNGAPEGPSTANRTAAGAPVCCRYPYSRGLSRLFVGVFFLLQLAGSVGSPIGGAPNKGAPLLRAPDKGGASHIGAPYKGGGPLLGAPYWGAPYKEGSRMRGPYCAFQSLFSSFLEGGGPCLPAASVSSRQLLVPSIRGPQTGGPLGPPQGRGPLESMHETIKGAPKEWRGPHSSLHAKGRPGGGGGVGPKKKTAQQKQQQQLMLQKQQQKQQQLQQLGGFAKHKKAKKAKEGEGGPLGTAKQTAAAKLHRKAAAKEGPPEDPSLAAADLSLRDLPYDLVRGSGFRV